MADELVKPNLSFKQFEPALTDQQLSTHELGGEARLRCILDKNKN
jgi:hypothetical protein